MITSGAVQGAPVLGFLAIPLAIVGFLRLEGVSPAAGLLGLAAGVALGGWAYRWLRRIA